MQEFKIKFLSSYFIAGYSNVKIMWLFIVVFSEHGTLHSSDNVHLFKYYTLKVPQNCFKYFNCFNQTCVQVSKFSFALGK